MRAEDQTTGKDKERKDPKERQERKVRSNPRVQPHHSLHSLIRNLVQQRLGPGWTLDPFQLPQATTAQALPAPAPQAAAPSGTMDLIQALKKAYQDTSNMPQGVREALDRMDISDTRQITKDLHAATTALGKARRTHQEAAESRRQLRAAWLQHLAESASAWESQLGNFRKSMAQLQDQEARALQEVSSAQKAIQLLNSQGGKEAQATDEQQLAESQDATALASAMDAEEEALRKRVHQTMKQCLVASGGELRDVQEISDEENKDSLNPAKRPRSVDPGALKTTSPSATS